MDCEGKVSSRLEAPTKEMALIRSRPLIRGGHVSIMRVPPDERGNLQGQETLAIKRVLQTAV